MKLGNSDAFESCSSDFKFELDLMECMKLRLGDDGSSVSKGSKGIDGLVRSELL